MKTTPALSIVVVDDENSVGTLCELKFRKSIRNGDMQLRFFNNARAYLKYLETTRRGPDSEVLLTDINMPDISGYELLKRVKEHYPSIGVYMMSAYDDESSIRKSLNLGAQGYFTKPVDYAELKSCLSKEYGVELA